MLLASCLILLLCSIINYGSYADELPDIPDTTGDFTEGDVNSDDIKDANAADCDVDESQEKAYQLDIVDTPWTNTFDVKVLGTAAYNP